MAMNTCKHHSVKLQPQEFDAILSKQQKHFVYKDDCCFQIGDDLEFREWVSETQTHTGRYFVAKITYITDLPDGLCVLSLEIQYFDLSN